MAHSTLLHACRALSVALFVGAMTLGVLTNCTRESGSGANSVPVGGSRPAFAFDAKRAVSLTIAKADPATGEHWIARMVRKQEKPETFYESDPWLIDSYSENPHLPDTLANRTYILHLIDTLSTYHANSVAQAEPSSPSAKNSYGLNPPRYALKWQVRDLEKNETRNFEIEIGNLVDPKAERSKEAFGSFPPDPKVYRVDGAALAMLDYLKGFMTLRQDALSPVTSDEIDEMEIRRGKKKVLYAQRGGDLWTDEKHHPFKRDVGGFVERMAHLRIQSFADSESELAEFKSTFRSPLEEILFKDRLGHPLTFRFARVHGKDLAQVPERGPGVFVLYPTALSKLEP